MCSEVTARGVVLANYQSCETTEGAMGGPARCLRALGNFPTLHAHRHTPTRTACWYQPLKFWGVLGFWGMAHGDGPIGPQRAGPGQVASHVTILATMTALCHVAVGTAV